MKTKHRMSDADRTYLLKLQDIQKRNAPDSAIWIAASKEINALVNLGMAGKLDKE